MPIPDELITRRAMLGTVDPFSPFFLNRQLLKARVSVPLYTTPRPFTNGHEPTKQTRAPPPGSKITLSV